MALTDGLVLVVDLNMTIEDMQLKVGEIVNRGKWCSLFISYDGEYTKVDLSEDGIPSLQGKARGKLIIDPGVLYDSQSKENT